LESFTYVGRVYAFYAQASAELLLVSWMKSRLFWTMTLDEGETMNLYVGNLSYGTTDDDLRSFFSQFGEVASAKVIKDRETGRSRGFGFVEMGSKEEGQAAIEGSNGADFQGRPLKVNESQPRERTGGGFRR
jgi:RNA recognition motif-containing protein